MSARRVLAAIVAVLAVALTGCATLPESGPVHRASSEEADRPQDPPYFSPPGPAQDGSPSAIVSGFLLAMQANPLSTSVARSYLTEHARASWKPNDGTIIYDAYTVRQTTDGAVVRLADTHRLDARGGWQNTPPGRSLDLRFDLVSEHGQWRIDNPTNALIVRTSFFESSFARFNLYFYDQTGRVLLPDPVFIPRGEQTATNLVRGLLAGPGSTLAEVSRSALPERTDLDLSVVVTESGVAEVPLSRDVLRAAPGELSRAVDQLAWTLRQVPGIERVRITVAGATVPLSGGRIDAPVTSGNEFDAAGPDTAALWGLRGGRVVDLASPTGTATTGPLGRPGYSMRSLAVSESPRRLAAVSGNGSTVFVAPAEGGNASTPVARPVVGGTDILRPSYDMFGDLWLIDRTPGGARVLVVRGDQVRRLRVPGVTGADVAAFSVARDGSRLAVAYAGSRAPTIRVTDILRTDEGIVSGAGRSRTFAAGGRDASKLVDLGWRDPSTLAVLSRTSAETSQVTYISADSSPVDSTLTDPNVFRGATAAMVIAPAVNLPLRLITPDQRLYTLSSNGNWPRSDSKVLAATYVR
ncbi:LpqB family beta-propeller domain-containing protein [Marmoricola sp. URHB0036]|uniref:LpqB family beta-propeller domain-containing protein n=1 Tax=Marmoricola sp. URHB0036 TaxID=1298863 RepID=UPI0003F52E0A|nr:LpqB family beta-propeller domain-containing protein [Marmoricola sp. URHB0036]